MTSPAPDAPQSGWGRPVGTLRQFVVKTAVMAELEIRKLSHDPTELLLRAVQPALWLLIFGEVFTRVRAIPTGPLPYLDYMAPGILAQSVLFIAIFYGIAIIWERDLGIVQKLLVSPTPRTALVLGKAISAGIRGVSAAIIIYGLAMALGVRVNGQLGAIIALLVSVMLGAACFSTLSLIIACVVKTRERFMGIGQILTMPLFFASSALYPIALMPRWLQIVACVNPLTYEVDALRALMLRGGTSVCGLGTDFTVLLGVTIGLVMIAGRLYPHVVT